MSDSAEFANRVTVAITGASGAAIGVRILEILQGRGDTEIHLIVSGSAVLTLHSETDHSLEEVQRLAHVVHATKAVGNCIASGSYPTQGMIVAPCSMRSLAAIAHGLSDNLITRAADVTLKERRPLVLLPRETPLNLAHLRNMTAVTEMGGIVMPPVPAFYHRPGSVDALINDTAEHAINLLGLSSPNRKVWTGLTQSSSK